MNKEYKQNIYVGMFTGLRGQKEVGDAYIYYHINNDNDIDNKIKNKDDCQDGDNNNSKSNYDNEDNNDSSSSSRGSTSSNNYDNNNNEINDE